MKRVCGNEGNTSSGKSVKSTGLCLRRNMPGVQSVVIAATLISRGGKLRVKRKI